MQGLSISILYMMLNVKVTCLWFSRSVSFLILLPYHIRSSLLIYEIELLISCIL